MMPKFNGHCLTVLLVLSFQCFVVRAQWNAVNDTNGFYDWCENSSECNSTANLYCDGSLSRCVCPWNTKYDYLQEACRWTNCNYTTCAPYPDYQCVNDICERCYINSLGGYSCSVGGSTGSVGTIGISMGGLFATLLISSTFLYVCCCRRSKPHGQEGIPIQRQPATVPSNQPNIAIIEIPSAPHRIAVLPVRSDARIVNDLPPSYDQVIASTTTLK